MAKLTKERARKPLIATERCWSSTGYDNVAQATTYRIEVADDANLYRLELTAEEMLFVVSKWLQKVADHMTLAPKPRKP